MLKKFRHNFNGILNPLCLINEDVDKTQHFLLHCHSYHLQRNNLFSRVQVELLSYGLSSVFSEYVDPAYTITNPNRSVPVLAQTVFPFALDLLNPYSFGSAPF